MAKILTTSANSYYIENIIKNAKKEIFIVSPFLKLNSILVEKLRDADKNGIQTIIIYGKSDLDDSQKEFLSELKNIEVYFYKNLHAKCYFNEELMVITSMNLYEFSEINNREIGVLIDKINDLEMYQDGFNEIISIKNAAIKELNFNKKIIYKNLEDQNLHLANLYPLLMRNFNSHNFIIDRYITIENFPIKWVKIIIAHRIDIHFEDKALINKYQYLLKKYLKETRIFINENRVSIYLSKTFDNCHSEEELTEKAKAFFNTYSKIFKILSVN